MHSLLLLNYEGTEYLHFITCFVGISTSYDNNAIHNMIFTVENAANAKYAYTPNIRKIRIVGDTYEATFGAV